MSHKNVLTADQVRLRDEIIDTYNVPSTEITYFEGDPEPFIGYEAACVMINTLAPDIIGIDVQPVEGLPDALSIKCTLTSYDNRTRSVVGVVHSNEAISGNPMNPQERHNTATSRAIRNCLRIAGIDLLRRHEEWKKDEPLTTDTGKSHRNTLIAQVHLLGREAGLIIDYPGGIEKRGWKAFLHKRYGVDSSKALSDDLLADLAAVLQTISEPLKKVA